MHRGCGRQNLLLRVGECHARVLCVCACACPSWRGRVGRPLGRVWGRLTFSCGRCWCALCLFSPPRAGVALFVVVVGGFFFLVAPPLSPAFRVSRPGVPWAWASCGPPPPPPFFLLFYFYFFLRAPLSLVFRGFQLGPPWALVLCGPPSWPPSVFFFSPSFTPHLLFACRAPVFCLFPLFFCFRLLPFLLFLPWCGRCVVLGLVCVSWAVGCAGVRC